MFMWLGSVCTMKTFNYNFLMKLCTVSPLLVCVVLPNSLKDCSSKIGIHIDT